MANDLLTKDLITYDPLSTTTRKQRTALLGTSILGIALVKVPLVPEKLAFLGIEFVKVQQEQFVSLYALIVVYYFAAFCIYAFTDYVAWRRQEVINLHEYSEQCAARKTEAEQNLSITRASLGGLSYRGFASYWVAFAAARARASFEFLFPICLAIFSLLALVTYK